MEPIHFAQAHGGYAQRTELNAEANITLAFAIDFNTAGERLTRKCVMDAGRVYHWIQIYPGEFISSKQVNAAVFMINMAGLRSNEADPFQVNIAGNGMYTLKRVFANQHGVDLWMRDAFEKIFSDPELEQRIDLIRSGGQTGIDEAGIKAAARLGFKTTVLAPKGWLYRNHEGRDIRDEYQFKARFKA